jgi:hypothetical protein
VETKKGRTSNPIKVTGTKTDNSYLADKVGMRVKHLPRGPITVLDCFAGTGRIWRGVKRRLPDREIKILGMEKQNYNTFHLPGDNVGWLADMDLSRFNVIDLDAYGVPYDQLRILFARKYHGTVFVTFVQLNVHSMPKGLLLDVGFTEDMYQKSPMLLCTRGFEYFQEWLAIKGLKHYAHRWHQGTRSQKHYLAFNI